MKKKLTSEDKELLKELKKGGREDAKKDFFKMLAKAAKPLQK